MLMGLFYSGGARWGESKCLSSIFIPKNNFFFGYYVKGGQIKIEIFSKRLFEWFGDIKRKTCVLRDAEQRHLSHPFTDE
jgi:hypothetical protein